MQTIETLEAELDEIRAETDYLENRPIIAFDPEGMDWDKYNNLRDRQCNITLELAKLERKG